MMFFSKNGWFKKKQVRWKQSGWEFVGEDKLFHFRIFVGQLGGNKKNLAWHSVHKLSQATSLMKT